MFFIFVATITAANFEVFVAYSNELQYGITALYEGEMLSLVAVFVTVWLILYNSTFSNYRTRYFTLVAIAARVTSWFVFSLMCETPAESGWDPRTVKWLFMT